MALITSPVPEIGAPNGTEQVDTTNLLQEIKNLLNGGLALDNLGDLLEKITDPPVVTALPGSPVTGQRARLRPTRVGQDSGELGPLWPLRCNLDAPGAHKWEADGGVSPLVSGPAPGDGFVSGSGSTYVGFSTWKLAVPVAGIYNVDAGGRTDGDTYLALGLNNSPDDNYIVTMAASVGARRFSNVQLAQGTELYFAHRSPSGGTTGSRDYWMSLTPVRIG